MKITSIKQQAKQNDRYSIYVDDQYSFSLSESALLSSGLAGGQELSRAQIDEYKQLSADDKLYNRTLRYVAMRTRSLWEVETYLKRKQATDALISQTLTKLQTIGLLDDAKYAASFVRDRQLLRPTSKRKLQLELRQKRIADEHIMAALNESNLDESISLREVIAKKRRQSKYQDNTKLVQYLARQGFGYSDIKSALDQEPVD